ncbi:MAG: chromosomal replication initiator protein DnaA [Firmicutes bacterium]|nr:chromosomal replication initiator protein DnaA [Bacillota bacterium]
MINYLEERLSAVTVSAWFDDAEVVELNEEHLILYSSSDFRREIIRRRCTDYIQDALKEIFNSDAKLIVFGDEELEAYRSKGKQTTSMDFNPQFSFDNFVVGPSNRFAHGAAIAVSNNPGQVYNPLFIYGPAGVGKTHLLYAIANGIRKNNPNSKIVYIKGDQFTNELIAAIQSGKNIEFRSKYREADLFLIDDIQFIAGKESTQEEFFHTFNTLYEEHKQIVMTSDRKPSDMLTLEDRLKTRFEWGLLADIQPPDYETRMAIIKKKATSLGLELPDDVCNYIAVNVTSNVRQIEGTVKKILAYRDLNGMELTLDNVTRVITDMFKSEGNALPTPGLIISQVCKFYSIDESVLRGLLKNKGTTEARQVAIYLIRKLTNLSLPDIGKEFGRDHSTILYAIRKVEVALKSDNSGLQNNIRDITANINSCL